MIYEVKYMPEAINDITILKRTNIQSYNKVIRLIREFARTPTHGNWKA
jgi:Txe/YoeB family toxin of Txe-Axe toxin-antitoxin module